MRKPLAKPILDMSINATRLPIVEMNYLVKCLLPSHMLIYEA